MLGYQEGERWFARIERDASVDDGTVHAGQFGASLVWMAKQKLTNQQVRVDSVAQTITLQGVILPYEVRFRCFSRARAIEPSARWTPFLKCSRNELAWTGIALDCCQGAGLEA